MTVVEPKIIFVQTRYEAHVSENLRPPVMVVDLNSSAETQGSRVVYQLIDGPRGISQITCLNRLACILCGVFHPMCDI